jgi:hypothetical protein
MKKKLAMLMVVAGGALMAQTRFSVGVQVGAPGYYGAAAVAPSAVAYRPPCPGPSYVYVDGYYDGYGNWFNGYWTMPPYAGAYWVAPRFTGGHYTAGYWGGARGYGRDEHRFVESRGYDRGRDFDRGRGRDFDHRGDFGRGFRR